MTDRSKIYVALSTLLTNAVVLWAIFRLLNGASFETQIVIVLVAGIVGTICDLYVFQSLKETTGELGLGASGMVSRIGVVTESTGDLGKVYIRGETWSARFEGEDPLSVGSPVEVVELEGLVLLVRQKSS